MFCLQFHIEECAKIKKFSLTFVDLVAGPVTDPKVLIEGVLFRARYLGSTQLVCEGQPTKATRMMQAEEAVSRIKVGHMSLREQGREQRE